MNTLVVGVGDCIVSGDEGAELVTYALGSCIAVAIWDPVSHISGLLHFMLPDSSVDRDGGGRDHPYRYADTGTPLLFRGAYRLGADKSRLVVRLAGGAAVIDDRGIFNIGARNLAALRKILWKAGVLVRGEDVGGIRRGQCGWRLLADGLWCGKQVGRSAIYRAARPQLRGSD